MLDKCSHVAFIKYFLNFRFIPESPRWLLTQNKRQEALEITKAIAKENKKTLSKIIEVQSLHDKGHKITPIPKMSLKRPVSFIRHWLMKTQTPPRLHLSWTCSRPPNWENSHSSWASTGMSEPKRHVECSGVNIHL